MNLESLSNKIHSCTLCDLSMCRTKAVPGEGPKGATIFFVGEAPGAEEDAAGRPFVGRAGRLLDKALEEAGIERSEVFITSVVKCRPPDNRLPKKWEMNACLPYLEKQIEMVGPRIICLMGNVAARAFLGMQGVTSLRGQVFKDRYLVTYHPAAVLRDKKRWDDFVSDLKDLKKY